jgi:hypothetical protein
MRDWYEPPPINSVPTRFLIKYVIYSLSRSLNSVSAKYQEVLSFSSFKLIRKVGPLSQYILTRQINYGSGDAQSAQSSRLFGRVDRSQLRQVPDAIDAHGNFGFTGCYFLYYTEFQV